MARISAKFRELEQKNEKALIAYAMAGYPSEKGGLSVMRGLIRGGADIIEIGFPFSDPLADGPVIQKASTASLAGGAKTSRLLSLVRKLRNETDVPLVLMTYTNILYHTGYKKFVKNAVDAGIDGFILPDMSIEESADYLDAARSAGADTIFLASPNTAKKRLQGIAKQTSGFLYLVTVYGTTGASAKIKDYSTRAVRDAKKILGKKIPVGAGFGISTPDDVRKFVKNGADAVIVGSAFLRLAEDTAPSQLEDKIAAFTKKLKKQTIVR